MGWGRGNYYYTILRLSVRTAAEVVVAVPGGGVLRKRQSVSPCPSRTIDLDVYILLPGVT